MKTPSRQGRRRRRPAPNPDQPNGYRAADASGVAVPSRALLLNFLSAQPAPVTLKQVRAHFGLADRAAADAVAARLQRMTAAGIVLHDRKQRYALPAQMDIVAGRVVGHANGYGFVIPDAGGDDLFLHHRQMRKVLHGDRVLARLKRIDDRGRKEGAVVEVVIDAAREIVGHFHLESRIGFVEPDDSRFARDITIAGEHRGGAEDGDIVAVKIIKHPVEHFHAVGAVVEVLGKKLAAGMETRIAIRKHGIPDEWPAAVTAQLNKMQGELQTVPPQKGRRDLRDLPLVTIDGEDARDFDDAVFCAPDNNGWRLVVAIADVGHYVGAGGALDDEALKRGNSVYFPNRVVPMLPAQLSNGICSLNPGEDRYCMVCEIFFDAAGEVKNFTFYPAMMHSQARLTYNIVNAIVADRDTVARNQHKKLTPHLDDLYTLTRLLLKRRRRRGTIDFEFPEADIRFDDGQKIKNILVRRRLDAHRLIEECMLAANRCAAQFLQKHLGDRAIYRNHRGPNAESLTELRRLLNGIGLTIGGGDAPAAADYAKLVATVANDDLAPLVQTLLLRSLSQAEYGTEQAGHFALAYPVYTHFTSPIRRYSDLVVHRQLRALLDKQPLADEQPALQKVAEQCSFTERRADDASRDVINWLKAEFMQDKVGDEFAGVISGVKEFGVFVQLDDLFVDGLVHVTGLGDDYFHFDPLRFQLVGERSGKKFRIGDRVRIVVARVALDDGKIDFELCVDAPKSNKKKQTKPKTRGKKKTQRRRRR